MADLKDLMKLRVVDLKERLIALGKSPKGNLNEMKCAKYNDYYIFQGKKQNWLSNCLKH